MNPKKQVKWVTAEEEIKSADKATQVAVSFLSQYYPFLLPLKATRAEDMWEVEVDVGAFTKKVAKVFITIRTGAIIKYEVSEAESLV